MTTFILSQNRTAWKALQKLSNSTLPHLRDLLKTPQRQELLQASDADEAEVQRLASYRSYLGNVPNTTIWGDALTPRSMGALMALYEHKVICQAAVWGLHAFDQCGVELGKKNGEGHGSRLCRTPERLMHV